MQASRESQHDGLNFYVSPDKLTAVQGKTTVEIVPSAVREIRYDNDVHRRIGAQ